MKTIQKISILGAGAMGAAYAAMFSDADGFSVSFIARGERYRRLRGATLTVNEKPYTIPAVHPNDGTEPADLVLVALKHHHLAEAIPDIEPFIGAGTIVLSVMNGLESEEMIGDKYGMDKLVYAISVGIDAVREGSRFTYFRPGKIFFGKEPASDFTERLDRVQEALNRAGIPNEIPEDILRTLWWKVMINVGINQASAVLKAPYGVFHSSSDAMDLMISLMREAVAVAQAAGIDLSEKDIEDWTAILSTLSPSGKTSMLQDIEAGRKTEVEIFAGKMVSLGREFNIPTPVNETALRIVKVMESRAGI